MTMNFQAKSLMRLVPEKLLFWKKSGNAGHQGEAGAAEEKPPALIDGSSSIPRALSGATTLIESYHFPPDIIGGMCPLVPGSEEEIAWHAAAEACDSERIHIVWQASDGYIWYIAVRSSELASHANSWCPFAAFLPGQKHAMPAPACYVHYGEDIATMMTVTEDGLRIYRGTNPIVRAKTERMAQELGHTSNVDLVPENIATLEPVPWYSISLFEERARRVLAVAAVALSLVLSILAFTVWLLASVSLVSSRHNLSETRDRTKSKIVELMNQAQRLRSTPVRDELTRFETLNEGLLDLNGYLEIYALNGNKTRWRATVPANVTADRINALGGKTIESKPAGTVIGNAAEIEFEAAARDKRK